MKALVRYQIWDNRTDRYEVKEVIVDATDFSDAYSQACDLDSRLEKNKQVQVKFID